MKDACHIKSTCKCWRKLLNIPEYWESYALLWHHKSITVNHMFLPKNEYQFHTYVKVAKQDIVVALSNKLIKRESKKDAPYFKVDRDGTIRCNGRFQIYVTIKPRYGMHVGLFQISEKDLQLMKIAAKNGNKWIPILKKMYPESGSIPIILKLQSIDSKTISMKEFLIFLENNWKKYLCDCTKPYCKGHKFVEIDGKVPW